MAKDYKIIFTEVVVKMIVFPLKSWVIYYILKREDIPIRLGSTAGRLFVLER